MKLRGSALAILAAGLLCGGAPVLTPAQTSAPLDEAATDPAPLPVPLEWTPPALAQLGSGAVANESFTLDRAMLRAAAGLTGDMDDQTRLAINKLDGVSVHYLRFVQADIADPALVDAIRDAYHLHGWKHVVTATRSGGPVRDGTTDVWVVMQGANVRGAVVMVETARSLTLATVAGNLSPLDLLHLRGHFGIPRFDGEELEHQR